VDKLKTLPYCTTGRNFNSAPSIATNVERPARRIRQQFGLSANGTIVEGVIDMIQTDLIGREVQTISGAYQGIVRAVAIASNHIVLLIEDKKNYQLRQFNAEEFYLVPR
jgi:hypothetical protein